MRASRHLLTAVATSALFLCVPALPAQQQAGAAATTLPTAVSFPAGPTSLILRSANDLAIAAFHAGHDAFLELDLARSAAEFRRAYTLDANLKVASAYELTTRGRSPLIADSIDKLNRLNGGNSLIESSLFASMRERHLGRAAQANNILNLITRAAPSDVRFLAEYHLWLAVGNAQRVQIARMLRAREPGSYRSHAYVALAINSAADSIEALEAMNHALRLGPDKAFAHFAAGDLLTRMRRLNEAATHLSHALRIDPAHEVARSRRAQVALYAGRYEDARADMRFLGDSAVYAGNRGTPRRAAALTYLHERNLERAQSEMEAVLRRFQSEPGWSGQIASTHAHLATFAALRRDIPAVERHLKAIEDYRDEDAAPTHFSAAVIWARAGQPARAREALTRYERLIANGDIVPAAADPPAARACVLLSEGKPAEALSAAANSANHNAMLCSYEALSALGRRDEAAQILSRLFGANNYALDAVALPVARYLYGGTR